MLRWLFMALLAAPSLANAQALIRVADYPNFGRVVFEFAVPTAFKVVEEGDRLLIVFEGSPAVGAAPRLPRNVRAIQGGAGSAILVMAPGTRFRSFRERSRVGIDILDPAPNRPGRNSTRPGPVLNTAVLPVSLVAQASRVELDPAAVSAEAPQAAPVTPVRQDVMPSSSQPGRSPISTSIAAQPASILLPFAPGVGAAAFRRANAGLVVFDQRVPVDLALLGGNAAFADASVQLGQAMTVLTVPLQADQALATLREAQGWRVTLTDAVAAAASAAIIESRPTGLLLQFNQPSQVVTTIDPSTGAALLVGTVNPATGAGQALTPSRRAPGYIVASTWLGVVIEPTSDLVELRPTADGFVLTAPGVTNGPNPPTPTVVSFSHRFDFPDLPVPALLQRLKAQVAAAAAAPPRARTADRMAAAQSLLSLGLATEAQAVLALIATEDPTAAADPNVTGLLGIAALLAGRSPEATGLDDPRLGGTDDIALWRGLRDAMLEIDPAAGRDLARLLPLANAYPAALRDRLRPLVIEAAVASGQGALVTSALAVADDAPLDFARALQHERDGDTASALLIFDTLAAGRDQLMQVRAGSGRPNYASAPVC